MARPDGVDRDGRSRSRARCPRPIHGRGPPITGAAVGRPWATRASGHEFAFPGMAPWWFLPPIGASSGVAHPSPTAPSLLGDRRRGRSVDNPPSAVARPDGANRDGGVEAERVVHGLSTVAVPQSEERRWVGGGQRARRTPVSTSWDRRRGGFLPRSGASTGVAHASPTAPSLLGDRGRGRNVDNPAKRGGSSGGSQPRRRCRSRARCPRPIHGRGPPVTRAAVGRRWATRATNHGPVRNYEFAFPGMAPWWVLSRNRRLVGGCPPFAHRAFVTWGTVAVDEAWTTPPSAVPRPRRDRSRAVSIRPAPPPDRSARYAASRCPAATSPLPPPREHDRDPHTDPPGAPFRANRRTKAPNSPRPTPPAESASVSAGSACARSAARTPAPGELPSASASPRGGSAP